MSPKVLFFLASLVIIIQSSVNGAKLDCRYDTSSFKGVDGRTYLCAARDNGVFTGERVRFDSVDGRHWPGYIIEDVQGVTFSSKPDMSFFPQNLENIFQNLVAISVFECGLLEIKQEDLKVFPKLLNLILSNNILTTIDKDLFKFNPELRSIDLEDNQISHIDPNVFDNLSNLDYLLLQNNNCKNALGSVYRVILSDMRDLLQKVRNGDCS